LYSTSLRKPVPASEGTLPHNANAPTLLQQRTLSESVTLNILSDFLSPEFRTCRRIFEHGTFVAMPETSVHKNDRTMAAKDEVWLAAQIAHMQAKAETRCMQSFSDQ
jgi:hypothetical protein